MRERDTGSLNSRLSRSTHTVSSTYQDLELPGMGGGWIPDSCVCGPGPGVSGQMPSQLLETPLVADPAATAQWAVPGQVPGYKGLWTP